MEDRETQEANPNRDPLSGAAGAHPVGVGIGAAGGSFTGAAVGATVGPVGAIVGAAIGGVVGGLAGKEAAESVDPTVEDAYWSKNYTTRPYVTSGHEYIVYQPAYRFGWESYSNYSGRSFEEIEPDLARDWDQRRGKSTLAWDLARDASRDAWHRVENTAKGNSVRR